MSGHGFVLMGVARPSLWWARAGVQWFEVDKPDVLRAKHKALTSVGASFSSDGNAGASALCPALSLLLHDLEAGARCAPSC